MGTVCSDKSILNGAYTLLQYSIICYLKWKNIQEKSPETIEEERTDLQSSIHTNKRPTNQSTNQPTNQSTNRIGRRQRIRRKTNMLAKPLQSWHWQQRGRSMHFYPFVMPDEPWRGQLVVEWNFN